MATTSTSATVTPSPSGGSATTSTLDSTGISSPTNISSPTGISSLTSIAGFTNSAAVPQASPGVKRLLVAWFRFTVNGGIGRFLNVARTLGGFGHEVAFVSISDETDHDWPDFPGRVLTLAEARQTTWDAVMVPGAGAPDDQLARLAVLREDCFGVRVQHLLNDPTLLDRFMAANRALAPDVVIANNGHWRVRDFRKLTGAGFHILPGAVDTDTFFPLPAMKPNRPTHRWIIGGFAAKNPAPLLEAAALLPPGHELHLYGVPPLAVREQAATLEHAGRLVMRGPLFGTELAEFYRRLDVFVTSETRAGWCNSAAEAMACGVPCVVTRHGTVDFARHDRNALVVPEISAGAIAAAVRHLTADADLRCRLARHAAADIRAFTWSAYCQQLLSLVNMPAVRSYYALPQLGLHGKWNPATRLRGLEPILADCAGASLLDLGAAEGIVGHEFACRGARPVHGFELEPSRVTFAQHLSERANHEETTWRQADLTNWSAFASANADLLLDSYDIVLFLGLYHHLPAQTRRQSLLAALQRTRVWFAIRTPEILAQQDDLRRFITNQGFATVTEHCASAEENLGWMGVYRREAKA